MAKIGHLKNVCRASHLFLRDMYKSHKLTTENSNSKLKGQTKWSDTSVDAKGDHLLSILYKNR